jgi:hypothetical protein
MFKMKMSIRLLMGSICAIAIALAIVRLGLGLIYFADDPHQAYLTTGTRVVVFCHTGQGVYADHSGTNTFLPKGTRCRVVLDYAGDRDDCIDDARRVEVIVLNGDFSGKAMVIRRHYLRLSPR